MGTGKSSVGRELARRKKRHFADLDEVIELKERRRIADIFAEDGEAYFRKLEKKNLKEISRQDNFVVACGGGVVLDKDNLKLMKDTGILVCLSAEPAVILKRVSGDRSRPLLNTDNPAKRIDLLLKMRAPYYMQADKIVDTSRISVKEAADRICRIISARGR